MSKANKTQRDNRVVKQIGKSKTEANRIHKAAGGQKSKKQAGKEGWEKHKP